MKRIKGEKVTKTQTKPKFKVQGSDRYIEFTDEEKEIAKNTSIIDYAESKGITLIRDQNGHNKYFLESNTSLKIDEEKNTFRDWGSKRNDFKPYGGVVNFAKYVNNINYAHAMMDVLGLESAGSFEVNKVSFIKEPFTLPQILDDPTMTPTKATQYLIGRGLEKQMILKFYSEGLIRQTRQGEVAFIWKNTGGKRVGGTIQGTQQIERVIVTPEMTKNTTDKYLVYVKEPMLTHILDSVGTCEHYIEVSVPLFSGTTIEEAKEFVEKQRTYKKQILKNSETGYGFTFSGEGADRLKEKIVVCESPIDLLSYYQLSSKETRSKTVYQSLEGRKTSIAEASIDRFVEKYGREPKEFIIAVDSDKAGLEVIENLKQADKDGKTWAERHPNIQLLSHLPNKEIAKDWNEFLQVQNSNMKSKHVLPKEEKKYKR